MCTGRVDIAFVLRAFTKGADGVFIGGCWPGECHYVTQGNYDALFNMHFTKKLLEQVGLNPDRLRLEWVAASEGARYAEVMNDFGKQLKAMGPLGKGEGISPRMMKLKLEAVSKLVPYAKLVERERMRVRFKTEQEYKDYFDGADFKRLFQELLVDKLAISQIMLLLGENTQSARDIAENLGLEAAEVSRHLSMSSRLGLIRFDEEQKRYALVS
jgi:F420-non-reducing hydrogenase iron-sulfur subunit